MLTGFDQLDPGPAHILHSGEQPGGGKSTIFTSTILQLPSHIRKRRAFLEFVTFSDEVLAKSLRLAEVVAFGTTDVAFTGAAWWS